MIEEELLVLINKDIDGDNTPAESAQLRDRLESNEEARKYHQDLVNMSHVLKQVEDVDPPARLRHDIMREIPAAKYRSRESEGFVATIVTAFRSLRTVRPAYAFSAGMAAGIAVLMVVLGSLGDTESLRPSQVSGTIVEDRAAPVTSPTDREEFDLNGVSGTLETWSSVDLSAANLKITADGAVAVSIEFDDAALAFTGLEISDEPSVSVDTDPGLIEIVTRASGSWIMSFDNHAGVDSPLEVSVRTGSAIFECRLSTGGD
ncbi:MAG: hypothetical protein JSU65_02490 [Candidatus Zixiibacteriota bacterium]|nr:MAG: hypothetical protein JSU65_02490 [candidate division Zixibacteria bacterium]